MTRFCNAAMLSAVHHSTAAMMETEAWKKRIEAAAGVIVDEAVKLHRSLGPGLLESVYETALAFALQRRGLSLVRQQPVPIRYRGAEFKEAFRADLVVEDSIILEIKSIDRLNPAHRKQLITYLRLSNRHLGFLLNFGAAAMEDGIVRVVDRLPE